MDYIGGAGTGLCTRNSAVGVKGSWGNAFAGNWDTPFKSQLNTFKGFFSGSNGLYGGVANLLYGGTGGLQNPTQTITGVVSSVAGVPTAQFSTAVSNTVQGYYRRQSNLVSYHSPSWNGFNVKGAYSTTNQATSQGGNNLNQRLWSFSADYANGPWFVGLGFERHSDFNPGNQTVAPPAASTTATYNGGDDDKWHIGGGYTFANQFKLSGLWTETTYEPRPNQELKVSGWAAFADWQIQGPHSVKAAYIKLDDTKGNSGVNVGAYKGSTLATCGISGTASCASSTGATQYILAYQYQFSKRTSVGFSYNALSNDANGTMSMGKAAATIGGDQRSYGMFTQHRF
jgi:predicted porin